MKTPKNPNTSSRRGFLLGAGAAAGTGAAVALGARQAEPVVATKPDTKGRGGGYHVTEHVKQYYRTTLV